MAYGLRRKPERKEAGRHRRHLTPRGRLATIALRTTELNGVSIRHAARSGSRIKSGKGSLPPVEGEHRQFLACRESGWGDHPRGCEDAG